MQKVVSSSQCQMCSTFGTSTDHQSVSNLQEANQEEEKSLSSENNEKSRGNIHEILHEFTKFYSNQKVMIDLKPKAENSSCSTNNRLHEILKTSSNENSKAKEDTFETYINIFHTAAAINFKKSHLLDFNHPQVNWVINLGDLSEEEALKQLAQKLPKAQHNMVPIILTIPQICNHSKKFKQTVIGMVDYCLCFKRNLDYQQSLAHAFALFQAWRQLNTDIYKGNQEEITKSWSNFANFPRKTCDDILTDWPTVRQLNSCEFLISLFLCGLNQKFPISTADEDSRSLLVPILIRRKLIYCCPSWNADEMSFLALTLNQVRQALEPSTLPRTPYLFIFKIFFGFIQTFKAEAMILSPVSTLESLSYGFDVSINDCNRVLKISEVQTILKIYEPFYQELSIGTLIRLLHINGQKFKHRTPEMDTLLRAIICRLKEITKVDELLRFVNYLFHSGYLWKDHTNLFEELKLRTDQLQVEIGDEFRLIHLTCKLSRCGVLPRQMVEHVIQKVNTFQPFIDARNKSEMIAATLNFEPFGSKAYHQRSVKVILDLDYTLEMDYPNEALRLCPKIRRKLDLLQESYGAPNRVSEAVDLMHQHFSAQLGEDKVYCGPVLPYNRYSVIHRNIVLCLKNGSLNQALDIPNEYRSSLDSPYFVKPPKVMDGYTWKCILVPPFKSTYASLSGDEVYRIKHLTQLGYEVVIFDRSDMKEWNKNALAFMSRSTDMLLKCLDQLQIK